MAPRFRFHDAWTVDHPLDRVAEVLVDLEHYPAWWPQVVAVARVDDDTARVLCRSRLPYTLDLVLRAEHREPPRLEISLAGDLVGSARWELGADGAGTRTEFWQDVRVASPLLRAGSRLARPLMSWNHARMMAGCRTGLARRLADVAP